MELQGKHFILGLTDGIVCHKLTKLVRLLTKAGVTVQVVVTETTTHFITPVTMQTLSGRPILTLQWDDCIGDNMSHISLSRGADAIIIAPVSTDSMVKLAHGMANDLLSTLYTTRDCPLFVASAMNRQMWVAPATQRNAVQLHANDVTLLSPDAGDQARGEVGSGRMLEPEDIVEQLIDFFQPKLLRGHRVLLVTGPISEPIDPVCGITNLFSGKMGFTLARATSQAGTGVTFVARPCHQGTPVGVLRINVQTARQMHDAVIHELDTTKSGISIAVTAVADWHVAQVTEYKLKKQNDADVPSLTFTRNSDILATVARRPNVPFHVGFAIETERLEEFGEAKRQKKDISLLVGNLDYQTFGHDDDGAALFDAEGITCLSCADKLTLTRQIVAITADRIHGAQS